MKRNSTLAIQGCAIHQTPLNTVFFDFLNAPLYKLIYSWNGEKQKARKQVVLMGLDN